MATQARNADASPEALVQSFIARFDARGQKLFKTVRAALRKRFPTANELAYDYNHAVLIAYSPTERGIEGIFSLMLGADGVRFYLMNGPKLPDPHKLLKGSGSQARYVEIAVAKDMDRPEVKALTAAAVDKAGLPLPAKGKGGLFIKSGGSSKPPRKKAKRARS